MADVTAALNVYEAMRSFWQGMRGPNIAEWQKNHRQASRIVGLVMRLEREYGR